MSKNIFHTLIVSIILAIFFTWFALANSQIVRVSLIFWNKDISLALVILISLLIGVIITGFIAMIEQSNFLRTIKELESKLKHDEEVINETRVKT